MIVTIFRSRVRADVESAALEMLGARMHELAIQMPGFISYKDFAAADGETVTIVEFESEEAQRAWREHPEHREAQRLARERFLSSYQIQIGTPSRTLRFP
ncbi:MAG TPA: antibiotic biosynthesis monooxygenase [Polyangia bacterium]|jgi:heme-degrading monooxygenase HmoA